MAPEPAFIAILLMGASGTWFLRASWRDTGEGWRAALWLGWLLLAISLLGASFTLGPVRGLFAAFMFLSVAALGVVASGAKIRAAKASRSGSESLAPEPLMRPSTNWRTTLRWLLAGPIGMLAAMAVGICYTVWVPGEPQTRLLIGGLIVPLIWGGAMAWTLADNRILRATAVLVGTAVAGFGLAILRGFQ